MSTVYSADTTEQTTAPRTVSDHGLRRAGPSARETLRNLLRQAASGLQIAPAAIDLVVQHAQITNWSPGQKIVTPADPSDFVYFLVSGAVRLEMKTQRRSVTVAFVPPGSFIGSACGWIGGTFPFSAVSHLPSLVALVSRDTMRRALERLRPEIAHRLVANEVVWLQGLVGRKARLLSSSLPDRLADELAVLARDFGRPVSDGVLIDLPLIHEDLAKLVVASRANVTRALVALRNAGTIAVVSRRIVLRRPATHR
jgi:CRP-like cAMP-binding protein